MSRYIDAENLSRIKFHPLPYTHIVPADVNAESYKRGWNDAIDSIIECEPTADVRENVRGEWIKDYRNLLGYQIPRKKCSVCGAIVADVSDYRFCPNCGADMRGES